MSSRIDGNALFKTLFLGAVAIFVATPLLATVPYQCLPDPRALSFNLPMEWL